MSTPRLAMRFIVLSGGGYEVYADNEAEPIVDWLGGLGITASVLRCPLPAQHLVPLDVVRSELRRLRAAGAGTRGCGRLPLRVVRGCGVFSSSSAPTSLVRAIC